MDNSLFSKSIGISFFTSILIHTLAISIVGIISECFSFINKIEVTDFIGLVQASKQGLAVNELNGRWPSNIEIASYLILTLLIGYLSGSLCQTARIKLLYRSCVKGNQWMYSILRYESDWYNYFSGFHEITPNIYHPEASKVKKIYMRDSYIWIEVNKNGNRERYFGSVDDFTLDKEQNVKSILLSVHKKNTKCGETGEVTEVEMNQIPMAFDYKIIQDIVLDALDYTDLDKKDDENTQVDDQL